MSRKEEKPLSHMGFYTLTDNRCRNTSSTSPLARCVLVLTEKCNFACPYCRTNNGEEMPTSRAEEIIRLWGKEQTHAILFTGGEPTLHPDLVQLVKLAKKVGIRRVGVGTNGSADIKLYHELWKAGVDDFSISLDADNPEDGAKLSGRSGRIWEKTVANIREISSFTRVTIGLVFDEHNVHRVNEIIRFTLDLGVSDIRVNPAAQFSSRLPDIQLDDELIEKYPILAWRVENSRCNIGVRGLGEDDAEKCWLVLDEMVVNGDYHYPCFIYMREGGKPIGKWGPDVRERRAEWLEKHDPKRDPICINNCADCCSSFNRKFEYFHHELCKTM